MRFVKRHTMIYRTVMVTFALVVGLLSIPNALASLLLFDDFDGNTLNTALWFDRANSTGSSVTVGNGQVVIASGTTNGGGRNINSHQQFLIDQTLLVLEMDVIHSGTDGGSWGFQADGNDGIVFFGNTAQGELVATVLECNPGCTPFHITIPNVDVTTWHSYRIELNENMARFYIDEALVAIHTQGIPQGKSLRISLNRNSRGTNHSLTADFVSLATVPPPLIVTTIDPPDNGRIIAPDGIVSATFSRATDNNTVNTSTFTVRGKQTGVYQGSYTFGVAVQFDATNDFKPGEEIVVDLSDDLQADDGVGLTPYTWQFRAAVDGGSGIFVDSGQSLGSLRSQGVVLGDLDSDGDLDAFISNGSNQPNKVWLNDGTGTFTDSGQNLGSSDSMETALGDLDSDGDLDAFVTNAGSTFPFLPNKVWFNDGTGTFTDSGQNLGNSLSIDVDLGDLDGDGDLDAFVGNQGYEKVWLNDGTGTFTDSGQSIDIPSLDNSWTNGLELGDLDGDGDLDAFAANRLTPHIVWLNDGMGNFTRGQDNINSNFDRIVALEDLDGDGDLDAFLSSAIDNVGNGNSVWFNNGTGTFTNSGQSLGSAWSDNVTLGDVDGDGDLDAFVSNRNPLANKVWLNNGAGTFTDSGQDLGSSSSRDAALADLDGDGDLDAFVVNLNHPNKNRVWLNDSPPTADVGGPYTGNEGAAISLSSATASDPDGGPLTISWSVDNPSACSFDNAGVLNPNLTCDDNDSYIATLTVDDGVNPAVSREATVTVNNVAPTATFSNDGPVDEGSSFTLSLTSPADPSSADTNAGFTYAFDCGDGSGFGAFGPGNSAACPTADNGIRAVKGKIKDKDNGVTEYSDSVTVNNVAPSVATITVPLDPVNINDQASSTIDVTFSDPAGGNDAPYTCDFDFDNDGGNDATASGVTGTSCSSSLNYAEPGVYTVKVTVTDKDSGSGSATATEFIVVYDPTGGFVTGGGWIDSSATACPDFCEGAAGKANFGFVSKYKKGANLPTGNTEFNFSAGGLNFNSDTYDWLVINLGGTNAQYKGSGTINGDLGPGGGYKFMLWAKDLDPGGTDTFRLKIWHEEGGVETVIYDNGFDQPIGGGNIKIHNGK